MMNLKNMLIMICFTALCGLFLPGNLLADSGERNRLHSARIFEPISSEPAEFMSFQYSPKLSDFSDLRISEIPSTASFDQKNSSIIYLGTGDYLVVWQDNRLGSYAIFGQKYNSLGAAVGSNYVFASRTDGYDLIEPKGAPNDHGGFYLAWRDVASGKIYCAIYDGNLVETVAPFIVNNTPENNYSGSFDIDNYGGQRFAVVWEDYGANDGISLRLFDSTGAYLSGIITVNDDALSVSHWVPSIAFDNVGGMGVVWEDYREGAADIYFQKVNSDGFIPSANLGIVAAQYNDSAQYLPEISYSNRDGFGISWLDNRDQFQKIYFQRFTGTGLVDGNRLISADTTADWYHSSSVDQSENLYLCWSENAEFDYIKLQKFTTDFALLDSIENINQVTDGSRWGSSLEVGDQENLIFSWTDYRNIDGDIFMHYYDNSVTAILPTEAIVNDDDAGSFATEPELAFIDSDNAAAVFRDTRNDAGDIFLQSYSFGGVLGGVNIKLNSSVDASIQSEPAIAISDTVIMSVWNDGRTVSGVSGQRIFGRYIHTDGSFLTDDFVVSDSISVVSKSDPDIALYSSFQGMAVWTDLRDVTPQIYGQFLDDTGGLDGSAFRISGSGDLENSEPKVELNGSQYLVSWINSDQNQIMIKSYDLAGDSVGSRIEFTNGINSDDIFDYDIAVAPSGDIYVLWESKGTEYSIYLSILNSSGAIIEAGIKINVLANSIAFEPSLSLYGDNGTAVTYIDNSSDSPRVFYRIMNSSQIVQDEGFVSSATGNLMRSPTVMVNDSRAWIVWSDSRSGGLSIYGAGLEFIPVDVNDGENNLIPIGFALNQNYPNPFNPTTMISFNLPVKSNIEITVYNILGEKVSTVINGEFPAGSHSVTWNAQDNNGQNLSTGVYLYRMTAGEFNAVNKMILMK